MASRDLQKFEKAQASRLLSTENRELRDVIRALERRLCDIQAKNNEIVEEYHSALKECERVEKNNQDLEAAIGNQKDEINELNERLRESQQENQELTSTIRLEQKNHDQSVRDFDDQVRALVRDRKKLEDEVRLVTLSRDQDKARIASLDNQCEELKIEIGEQKSQVVELQREIARLRKFEDQEPRLKDTIQRKVDSIRNLESVLSDLASEGISLTKLLKKHDASMSQALPRPKVQNDSNWIPENVQRVADEVTQNSSFGIPATFVNELLTAVNREWRDKQMKDLFKLKQKHGDEMSDLRSRKATQIPTEREENRREVARLKKEINNLRHKSPLRGVRPSSGSAKSGTPVKRKK